MATYPQDPIPPLDGWRVARHDTAPVWSATRRGGVTDLELEYGCQLRVTASTYGELEVLTVAENVKRSIVAAAARMADRMMEDGRAIGGARSWPHPGPGGGISA